MSSSNKDVKIAPGAVVCLESKLRGHITVGSMTVVHPKASVIAEAGPITIGENNIIEEQASIIYRSEDSLYDCEKKPTPLNIGVNNVFEVGCEVHAKSIGDHNVFEPKCYVGPNVEIGSGCIIGAGCRVTVAEKLVDQTVITGRTCTRSIALDRPPDSDDILRQNDELTVMNEIFTKEEFSSVSSSTGVYAIFETHISLPKDFVLLLTKQTAKTEFTICHLPPIRLVAFLPPDYPSQNHPDFTLSCCWLSKIKLDEVAAVLGKLWEESQCEILFIWCSFLKDQVLDLLNLSSYYDLTEKLSSGNRKIQQPREDNKCKIGVSGKSGNPSYLISPASSNGERYNNRRRGNYRFYKKRQSQSEKVNILDENLLKSELSIEKLTKQGYEKLTAYHKECVKQHYFNLIEYNASKSEEEFKKNLQDCNVCFSPVFGELCKQLSCGHVTCTDCLKRMCEFHIKQGTTEAMVCAQESCGLELPANLVRELVSRELFDRFDRLMLNRTLDKISDMTYCPRVHCQYPVTKQSEDSLAECPSCRHAFCVFCKRAYHGVEGCRLKSDEKRELIEQYQNGGYDKRLELEKRYGKKQLTELVNAAQSELWMSENSKQCPCCHINIEKNDGCNKMICRKCNTNFCWMCLTRVSSLNPYLHFQDPKSKCFNLLFEGTYQDDQLDELEFEGEDEEEVEEFE